MPKSGAGLCPKCNQDYADLLEHITKRHAQDRFTATEIGGTGLMACPCGRVVLNRAGLSKHQLR